MADVHPVQKNPVDEVNALQERVAELEQQVSMLSQALDTVTDMVVIKDQQSHIVYANKALCTLYGMTRDDLCGLVDAPFNEPDYTYQYMRDSEHVFRSGKRLNVPQEQVLRHDGKIRTLHSLKAPLYNQHDQVIMTVGVSRDITDMLRTEKLLAQTLRENEGRLQLFEELVENSPDAIAVADMNGIITYVNLAFAVLYDYGAQALGMHLSNFYPVSEREHIVHLLRELLTRNVWQGTLTHRRQDGSTFEGEQSLLLIQDKYGKAQSIAVIVRDISERRQMEKELQRSQMLFETFNNNTPAIIFARDLAGRFLTINRAYCQNVFQKPFDDIIGKTLDDLYPPDTARALIANDQHVITTGTSVEREEYVPQSDGTHIYLAVKFPLYDADGNVYAVGGVSTDITARKRIEAEQATLQEQVIAAQRATLRELSTPLIPLSDSVLVMPLIGAIDRARARQIMQALLEKVSTQHTRVVLIDITGVTDVDSHVADALLRTAQAVKLLGAEVVITGIQPAMAQTLVQMGIDLSRLITRSTLQGGIAYALQQNGRLMLR